MKRTWTAIGIQFGTAGLGYLCGHSYPGRPPTLFGELALLGMVLLAVALFALDENREYPRFVKPLCVAVLLYMAVVVVTEPFLDIWGETETVIACLLLVPLVLALGKFIRVGTQLPSIGVGLFLFASTAMLTWNAGASDFGSGFHTYWRT